MAEGPRPDAVAGGDHWRIETTGGPLHVWRPAAYRPATAGLVIYIHGYDTTADETWEADRLGEQFQASRRNALFLVPEAPSSGGDAVRWERLGDLLEAATRGTGIAVPPHPVVAVGHSGAYRTLIPWLGSPRLEQVILLDALYGRSNVRPFRDWLRRARGRRRLIVVGAETVPESRQLLRSFRHAVHRDEVPESVSGFAPRERRARLLSLRSQYGHQELVSAGKVIAPLLALTSLAPLAD